jgi:hypothetical protein
VATEAGRGIDGLMESPENDTAVFRPSHRPWKSIKPIPHSHRHNYDEDEYILKTRPLRATHSEGKVISPEFGGER